MDIDENLNTNKITPELIQYITEKIVSGIEPDKVILFGSRARGDYRRDSDLDLFIIKDSKERSKITRRKIEALLRGRKFSLDLLVRKPEEVEWNLKLNNPFYLKDIFKEGRVLYERRGK